MTVNCLLLAVEEGGEYLLGVLLSNPLSFKS